MDKQPPSLAAATRMAAQAGGSLKVGDRVVNPSGARMSIARPYLAQPAPELPKADDRMDMVVELVQAQSRVLAAQAQSLPAIVASVVEAAVSASRKADEKPTVVAAPAMRPIRFVIDRDDEGCPVAMSVEYGPGSPTRKPALYAMKGADGLVHEVNAEY